MDFLHVEQGKIVDSSNHPIALRGVNVGGWMNMEHFINGYSGSEAHLRTLMRQELGAEKAEFFFDRLLDHFFNENDVRWLQDRGVNLLRLPLNYRHFEDDMQPFEYLEKGFKRLDQTLEWCEKAGIYVLLDLHSVQGWQNGDWHCDNSSRYTQFWGQKQFQDRFYALWKEIARRYKHRPVIAAYDLINEPLSNAPFGRFARDDQYRADWTNYNRIMGEAIAAIRSVDAQHMILLEGDYYSVLFDGMDRPADTNVIFSNHNYIEVGTGDILEYPVVLNGVRWDKDQIAHQFKESEGYRVAQAHNLPLVVSEFGFHNNHASGKTGPQVAGFSDQLAAYNECGVHWTFWTYKDIGSMGWVQLSPECAYTQTVKPLLNAKAMLGTDFGWLGGFTGDVKTHIDGLSSIIGSLLPMVDPSANLRYFSQAAMSTYTADQLQWLFVKAFAGKSETRIDEILQSFEVEHCVESPTLNRMIEERLKF